MTFAKWWKENQNKIESNISCQNFTGIKSDFESCWYDGHMARVYDPVCTKCGDVLIEEELICDECRK